MDNISNKRNYMRDNKYDYNVRMERIDLDKECEKDLKNNDGFVVTEPRGIKKTVKDPDGVFSTKFGQTLQDMNPFVDKYKCECGETMGRINHGIICPICKTEVLFIDDRFDFFGWIKLIDRYCIIHPNLFKSLEFLIGSKILDKIIKPIDEKDQDGFTIETERSKDEPFLGIGILEFKDRIDEILEFYVTKNKNKVEYYEDIMENKDKLFIHSIPVYTTLLRPFRIEDEIFHYEEVNKIYVMMAKLAHVINYDKLRLFRNPKSKKQLLYDLQIKYNNLYKEIISILSSKKGRIRSLFGGNCNFTARNVIISNPRLRIDQVTLSYFSLVELLQQSIINILCKSYNMGYNDAYKIWYKASLDKDDTIYSIIQSIIKNHEEGIPVLINRNPTISYGGIVLAFVIDIDDAYTMSIPLQILKMLGADFDGDEKCQVS